MLKVFKKLGNLLRDSAQPTEHTLSFSPNEKKCANLSVLESGDDVQETPTSELRNQSGMSLEYKRVDEIYDRKTNQWIARDGVTPRCSQAQAKRSPYERYTFTIMRTYDMHPKPSKNIYTTTIDIKSEYLQKACEEVIGKIQGLSWTVKPLRIDPQIILAFLPQLQQHSDTLAEQESKTEDQTRAHAHLKLLVNFMRTEYADTLTRLSGFLAHGEIAFDLLWALLFPRTLIYFTCPTTGEPGICACHTFAEINPNYALPTVQKTLDGFSIDKTNIWRRTSPEQTSVVPRDPEDSDLLLASPIVYGFSLADKLWLEFNIDHKTLVRSLVEAHSKNLSGFDDFVKGKGRGLVINLFGKPGVGKSMTAEATSEHVRRPLYIVGAGDLGISASKLDASLTRIFNVSAIWGAVVLIDEADVFLEERSLHDLRRNAVVAVFLRQLEYFRGILFLTTNRVRTFDEAFQSRIHVSLRYADLTPDARCTIWTAFLTKTDAGRSLSDEEILALGQKDMNGRQIKNAVRTADALARTCGESLVYAHLLQVLEMMEPFEIARRTARIELIWTKRNDKKEQMAWDEEFSLSPFDWYMEYIERH
ncbi:hypothetical protein EW145_g1774 [Phellinidium pouzarii]|uniref:AAA+ ATPase domain-containing protein n=1 Tax=Phellinidium pouzarii TaxID=167371 RepID=A0A4S4LF32_9AGAM|nr:hypothetical protein EW145_g1774 [Phellinidium pouzarii]